MRTSIRSRVAAFAVATAVGLVAGCTGSSDHTAPSPTTSSAGGPPGAQSWLVTLGDSYISGEGTRWAGNTSGSPGPVDAQGPHAYWDTSHGESIVGCHRSRQSIADVGGYLAKNLACSGAQTATIPGPPFKPGIDFFRGKHGQVGQALALQRFASSHQVSVVMLNIGGNDFGFANLVSTCVADFVTSTKAKPVLCSKNPALAATFKPSSVATVRDKITTAIVEVAGAMQKAGYDRSEYSLIVLDYPDPIPSGSALRYPETTAARADVGGCPVWNADADWAADTVVPAINGAVSDAVDAAGLSNLGLVDLTHAFDKHRLCEKGAAQLSDTTLRSWRSSGAAGALEWVNMVYTKGAPWQEQESFHPNFWGMLAERSCLSQVLATTPPSYGSCMPGSIENGKPVLSLVG